MGIWRVPIYYVTLGYIYWVLYWDILDWDILNICILDWFTYCSMMLPEKTGYTTGGCSTPQPENTPDLLSPRYTAFGSAPCRERSDRPWHQRIWKIWWNFMKLLNNSWNLMKFAMWEISWNYMKLVFVLYWIVWNFAVNLTASPFFQTPFWKKVFTQPKVGRSKDVQYNTWKMRSWSSLGYLQCVPSTCTNFKGYLQ